ncbi:MAG: DEAD/DEAH box helicase [Deltaproteobacteria bacterium]|jgi:DNA repair protein RadD|nr:DEAD/DEAH box helicase [Deltaproteobacteria bacterium]
MTLTFPSSFLPSPEEQEFVLRPYQEDCVVALLEALQNKRRVLLEMATGGGKTIIFSALAKHYMETYPKMSVGILAHRTELVLQARDKLQKVWPSAYGRIGIACASLQKVNTEYPIIIGTVQTLATRTVARDIHLLIVDEAHHIGKLTDVGPSQYQIVIEKLLLKYPTMRVLGVTATPFRLNTGYIYGHENDFFSDVDYRITMNDLVEEGWLVPIRAKEAARIDDELQSIKTTEGEYHQGQLSELMSKKVHIQSAVNAYKEFGESRRNVLVFAVTIEHAEVLTDAFNRAGYEARVVHSKLDKGARTRTLNSFAEGKFDILVNVGVLTEGWDSPRVDLILMARPTLSPGLFVQMVGRGTRIREGKKDVLVLDLVGNFTRHGHPSDPTVSESTEDEHPGFKVCPICRTYVPHGEYLCPECGYVWQPPAQKKGLSEADAVALYEIFFQEDIKLKAEILQWDMEPHVSRKGNRMARLSVFARFSNLDRIDAKKLKSLGTCVHDGVLNFFQYFDFEGTGSQYGQKKAKQFWRMNATNTNPPGTVDMAVSRKNELRFTGAVELKRDGEFWKVKEW